jgi:hypothetical protein
MPYLYGRNNQHGLNGVSRALHNRYLEGAFNTQFRLAGNTPKSERFVTAIESIRPLRTGNLFDYDSVLCGWDATREY